MRTEVKVVLVLMIIGTLALFWDDVLAAVNGMTPLEAAEFIWMVTVKSTVLAICAWLASTVPHIVKPWLKLVKRRQRQAWRSGPNAQWKQHQQTPKMPKWNSTERALLLWSRLQGMDGGGGRRMENGGERPTFRWRK